MTERTIDLDLHRIMAAQQATELRLRSDVEANAKAHYLLSLSTTSPAVQGPRRRKPTADALEEFKRLSGISGA